MPNFLITRVSAIGDCILTMPLLCALRDHYPQTRIAWLAEATAAPLLVGHAALSELVVVRRGWLKSPTAIVDVRRRLRALDIDLVLDPQSLTKTAVPAWLSGARRRIGFTPPRGRELAPWLNNELVQAVNEHVVDAQLELLRPLGITAAAVRFDVPRHAVAQEQIDRFWCSTFASDEVAVIHPGAAWASKRWPPQRYGEVARFLAARYNLRTLIAWGGPGDQQAARLISTAAEPHAIVAPQVTLPELAEVMRRARLFVGSDTGPMHLAAAVGTPCVALYGPSLPAKSGPYGLGHVSLQAYYQEGTSRQRRRAPNDAMRAITVDEVCRACERSLTSAPPLSRARLAS